MRKYWTIAATATHAPYKIKDRRRFSRKLSSCIEVLKRTMGPGKLGFHLILFVSFRGGEFFWANLTGEGAISKQNIFFQSLFQQFILCLNKVYESSASTFAIKDQLKGSK